MVISEQDSFRGIETRKAIPKRKFGLSGISYFGLPARDGDVPGTFIEQILSGVECYRAGYSEEDQRLSRLRHIFYHAKAQLVEIAEIDDGASYPDTTNPDSSNTNPHSAFSATAEGPSHFLEHLKRAGVPVDGPRTSSGTSARSIYFRDLDGDDLETATREDLPAGATAKRIAEEYGFIAWKCLSHK